MPRTPKRSSMPFKPYTLQSRLEVEEEEPKPRITSSPSPVPSSPTKRSWSSEEFMQLHEHVKKNGCTAWDRAVQDRTGNQCYKVWIQTLDPYLKNAIMSKGRSG
ncbi:hypothetical protein I302_103946 [Kwoniella bestiolae CBS 10118]|uniref:Myb-like domain-containing protein n=1 Tax=Kwoniella bestiolae CBS 10118 TaxID=1296100 RepID=A0A1B9G9W6_9TREE|nr:hypothetical protein I302_02652 [Kwoniella bestiolae CBS 10118]OCF27803.1 hypothetical protein I302_02652 [Kwoniella bestiolae CBS 10118]